MKGMIQIAYEYKGKSTTRSVPADIVGLLAVHRTIGHEEGWTITHCKTGHAIYRFFCSRNEALNVATAIKDHEGWSAETASEIVSNTMLKATVVEALRQVGIQIDAQIQHLN